MVCDCAVPATDSAICSLLYWAMRLSLTLQMSTRACTHTHTQESQSPPQPKQKTQDWLSLSDFNLSRKFTWVRYLNTTLVRSSFFMENCEVRVAKKPGITTCKATQHGRWIIRTDGTSQKKKKIAPQKDACWKGISIDVRHEQCNKTAIGGDKKNFLELLRTILLSKMCIYPLFRNSSYFLISSSSSNTEKQWSSLFHRCSSIVWDHVPRTETEKLSNMINEP